MPEGVWNERRLAKMRTLIRQLYAVVAQLEEFEGRLPTPGNRPEAILWGCGLYLLLILPDLFFGLLIRPVLAGAALMLSGDTPMPRFFLRAKVQ